MRLFILFYFIIISIIFFFIFKLTSKEIAYVIFIKYKTHL
jgi:hypothetical protein